jgi:hypothetical protein
MFRAWHRPRVEMNREDWIFIGSMLVAAPIAFAFGFAVGLLLTK